MLLGYGLLGRALVRTQRDPGPRLGGLLLVLALPLGILLAVVLWAIAPRTDLGFWAAITVPYGVTWLCWGMHPCQEGCGQSGRPPRRA